MEQSVGAGGKATSNRVLAYVAPYVPTHDDQGPPPAGGGTVIDERRHRAWDDMSIVPPKIRAREMSDLTRA